MDSLERRVLDVIRIYNTPDSVKERVREDARKLASVCRKRGRPDLSEMLYSETDAPRKLENTEHYREKARTWLRSERQLVDEPENVEVETKTKYTCRSRQRFKR